MKKRNNKQKWKAIALGLMIGTMYCAPHTTPNIMASTFGAVSISGSVKQSQSNLQPGDTFSLTFNVLAQRDSEDEGNGKVYITKAIATGSGIDNSKATFSAKEAAVGEPGESISTTVTISGLIYTGGSKEVEVTAYIGRNLGDTTIESDVKQYTLSAKTSADMVDQVVVEKQNNLIVKTGETQNIEVKVTNKGSFTVNQADVQLSLNEKVEGLKIKTDKATVKNISAKGSKNAQFSLTVDKETKAGVYPATVTVFGNSYPVNIQVDSNVVPSALEVSVKSTGTLTPGTEKTVSFNVKNVGDRDAKNIRMELVNTENLTVVESSNVKRFNVLQAKSNETISMKVRVNSSFKGDSVAVPVKLTYLSSTGEQAEDIQYVYLYTTNNNAVENSEVIISNVISPTGTFGVDQNFNVKFNVSSKQGAENIQISVEGDEGIVPKSQNVFSLNKLAKGESKQYTVTFAATREAVSSSHPIKITVTYGKSGETMTINQYGSVSISNPKKDKTEDEDEKTKGKPKVIIGTYSSNPMVVKAGEEFDLEIGFLNTNDEKTVKNLKANLTVKEQGEEDTGSVFTPVGASNTFFIRELTPGQSETKTIRLYTLPSAKSKTYEISIDMEYEDSQGEEITASEKFGIPVEQVTKLEIAEVNIESTEVGRATELSATIYNTGKTEISNIRIKTVGEGFEVEDNALIIGSLEKGASKTYMPIITPLQEGPLTGKIEIQYEDMAGQVQNYEYEFQMDVAPNMMDEMLDMDMNMPMEEPDKAKGPGAILGIVGLGIAALITGIMMKKRKQKSESDIDED